MNEQEGQQMHDAKEAERVIDVGQIQPQHRHGIIFQPFEHLEPGNSLQLVVDHDPQRLRFQLDANYDSKCDWYYLKQGLDVWRGRLRHLRDRPAANTSMT